MLKSIYTDCIKKVTKYLSNVKNKKVKESQQTRSKHWYHLKTVQRRCQLRCQLR